MSRNQLIPNWKEFLLALEKRFGLCEFEVSFDELSNISEDDRKVDVGIEANGQGYFSHGREEKEYEDSVGKVNKPV